MPLKSPVKKSPPVNPVFFFTNTNSEILKITAGDAVGGHTASRSLLMWARTGGGLPGAAGPEEFLADRGLNIIIRWVTISSMTSKDQKGSVVSFAVIMILALGLLGALVFAGWA